MIERAMIPEKKFLDIAKGLMDKTKKRSVDWKMDSAYGTPPGSSYVVSLPRSSVKISYLSPSAEPDKVRLTLLSPQGETAGYWDFLEGDKDWDFAQALFWEVQSFVAGSNKVLEDVERFISSDPDKVKT